MFNSQGQPGQSLVKKTVFTIIGLLRRTTRQQQQQQQQQQRQPVNT